MQSNVTVADGADKNDPLQNADDAEDDVPIDESSEKGEPETAVVHTEVQHEDVSLKSDETDIESSHNDVSATEGPSEDASTARESPQDPILPTAVKVTALPKDVEVTSPPEKESPVTATATVQKSPAEKQFLRKLQENLHSELQSEINGAGHLSTTPAEREAYLQTVSSNKRDRPPDFEEDRPDQRTRRKIRFTPFAPVRL